MMRKNKCKARGIIFFLLILSVSMDAHSQYMYGTTGLLHAPTADMQRDKTFMIGGSYLNKNVTAGKWRFNTYVYDTFNYYINITIFPWMEVGYNMILNQGIPNSSYWPEQTWRKFSNQDRSFHGRLRLWKEGWWKEWTPQIVFGANDPATHDSYGGGGITTGSDESGTNNYLTRWYLAATRHFLFKGVGEMGVHVAFIWGRAKSEPEYKRPSAGVNFQFALEEKDSFWRKAVNGLNLMAEMCPKPTSRTTVKQVVNIGMGYRIWKDHINLVAELNECRHFAGGVYFKVHLK